MARVYNFNPGPAVLPLWALEEAQKELLDYKGTGMSILESSHRSKDFEAIVNEAQALLKELWRIPDNFKILFVHGGASSQFFMIPMNLAGSSVVDYVITGQFAQKAMEEAKIMEKKVHIVFDGKDDNYKTIPNSSSLQFSKDAAYVHITTNNTIFGTQWKSLPETNGIPLVADMSSDIFSYYIDWKNIGLIYAGAQKNLGPSGVALVIIREDLLEKPSKIFPLF